MTFVNAVLNLNLLLRSTAVVLAHQTCQQYQYICVVVVVVVNGCARFYVVICVDKKCTVFA
ncbi:hypothetical protein PR003_g31842 [Phytophthora rubi]|uniref:Secreted protein n=1 Tax=Phytophthora rubi TaxID=129364 RepID=A0A6A4B6M5_9STRA|nr:hypothetical protein PR003_g31842 [Phytophthora rubi]